MSRLSLRTTIYGGAHALAVYSVTYSQPAEMPMATGTAGVSPALSMPGSDQAGDKVLGR